MAEVTLQEQALRATIKDLYTTFSRYHLRPNIENRSPHYDSYEGEERLYSRPLKGLPIIILQGFAFNSLYEVGDEKDFKHFLPRMLELQALDTRWGESAAGLLSKLRLAVDWRKWTLQEQNAIEEYLMAWWKYILASDSKTVYADECLTGIAQIMDDMKPFLRVWERDQSISALRQLAAFAIQQLPSYFQKGIFASEFGGERRAHMQQVFEWLRHPGRAMSLEKAFLKYMDEPFADEIAMSVELLEIARGQDI